MKININKFRLDSSITKNTEIILDTNILSSCIHNTEYFEFIRNQFKNAKLIIDPIVKFEFLRGEFIINEDEKKRIFIQSEVFYQLPENKSIIDGKIYENMITLAQILTKKERKHAKLGDIILASRLIFYKHYYLMTEDRRDFIPSLFNCIDLLYITTKKEPDREHIIKIIKPNMKAINNIINNFPRKKCKKKI